MRLVIEINEEYDEDRNSDYQAEIVDGDGWYIRHFLGESGSGRSASRALLDLAENLASHRFSQKYEEERLAAWNKQCLDWNHIRKQHEGDVAA